MNANELADKLLGSLTMEYDCDKYMEQAATMLRQQKNEIEDLKSANRFIQNFAEEQHKRAVALEMRELTDEEINKLWAESHEDGIATQQGFTTQQHYFAHLILRKAQE
jgi:predicted house-cleaning NTP pyrophosphatase (Maf/HAM1 superfamily)